MRIAIWTAAAGVALVGAGAAVAALPNGVASGDVTTNSAVLWAETDTTGAVTFEISTNADFSAGLLLPAVQKVSAFQPVKVEATGLTPGATYFYRATDASGATKTGKFVTADAAGVRNGFKMGVTGDWRGEVAPYPAVKNVVGRNLDLFVELGDTIYADYSSPRVPKPQAQTLDEYRRKYAETLEVKGGLNALADVRSNVHVLATIDDHEVTNDFSGGATIASDGAGAANRFLNAFPSDSGSDLQNQSTLYKNGLQAFTEWHPMEAKVYAGTGDARVDGRPDLYRSRSYGADAAVFVLDNRSFRDVALADPDLTLLAGGAAGQAAFAADTARFYAESAAPGRTMLGNPQLARLKGDLLAAEQSGTTWKFVSVPEPMQRLGPTLGPADKFEGYGAERNDLLAFIDNNQIKNVVFVAADIHGTIVNDMNYTDPVTGAPRVSSTWEISTGSVGFSQPLGQSLFAGASALGLLTPQQQQVYNLLPAIGETPIPQLGGLANKDDFLEQVLNATSFNPFGISSIGLQDAPFIDADLIVGDYIASHTYGWTEFEVGLDGSLLVTTYGVEAYTPADVDTEAEAIAVAGRTPVVVQQFRVSAVPEPTGLAAVALAGLVAVRRRR